MKNHTFSHVCSSWKDKTHFLKKYKNSKFYCRTPLFSKGFVNIIEISKCVKNMKISLLWLIFIVFQRSLAVFMFFKLLAPCLCSSVEHVFKKVFRWYSTKCFENSQKNTKIYWKQKCVAKQKPLRKIFAFLIIILALS